MIGWIILYFRSIKNWFNKLVLKLGFLVDMIMIVWLILIIGGCMRLFLCFLIDRIYFFDWFCEENLI